MPVVTYLVLEPEELCLMGKGLQIFGKPLEDLGASIVSLSVMETSAVAVNTIQVVSCSTIQ